MVVVASYIMRKKKVTTDIAYWWVSNSPGTLWVSKKPNFFFCILTF